MRSELPVVVAGGGPVGLVAACLLGDLGVPTILVERTTAPHGLPRAVHLDDEAQRILDGVGVLGSLTPAPVPARAFEFRDAAGRLLFAVRPRRRSPTRDPSVYFHQPAAEAALRDAVRRRPAVDARFGSEVSAVDASGRVVVRGPDGDREQVLAASAVLACDGAASAIRSHLGVTLRDLGYEQTWAVVDVLLDAPAPRLAHLQQRCDPHRPATSVPTGGGRHRFELRVRPGERPEALLAPAALRDLLGTWGVDPAGLRVERAAAYTFHAVLAERWRVGAVFLLGDAAHQMPPFLGQGLGAGLRDAANLAWKLALARRGIGGSALLDTYQRERRRQVGWTIRQTVVLGELIAGSGGLAGVLRRPVAGAVRTLPPARAAADGLRPPALPRGPLVQRRAPWDPAGHPFPETDLRAVGGREAGDGLLGDGFALVGLRGDPLAGADPAAREVWRLLGARRIAVDASGLGGADGGVVAAVDACGTLARWFARAWADVAVVRPDRVVLAAVRWDRLDEVTARLARLLARGMGRSGPPPGGES